LRLLAMTRAELDERLIEIRVETRSRTVGAFVEPVVTATTPINKTTTRTTVLRPGLPGRRARLCLAEASVRTIACTPSPTRLRDLAVPDFQPAPRDVKPFFVTRRRRPTSGPPAGSTGSL
jgi:hypothetical protein